MLTLRNISMKHGKIGVKARGKVDIDADGMKFDDVETAFDVADETGSTSGTKQFASNVASGVSAAALARIMGW
jgi:hypothetical protein